MVRTFAILFGVVFLILGVLGFVPAFVNQGKLLDIFRINFEHNIVHLGSGVIAILCGLTSRFSAKMFFMIGGCIYGLLALFGFLRGEEMLFGMIATNTADNWLHAGIAAIGLWIGLNSEA